ncbi:AAA family ATPase [Sphingomonas sp. So64.6b]|uniref:AAA family ATPase n=1 Tax=Sphingomonas sp. So64.6b TaxID=2997354 RepID=UPI0016031766|nr:AAA family ATPase [Sphingomonas sp. So64.6b]QNA86523.1 AAA family ATPase [Sphingomonas sp. So64.6b]
MIEPDLNSNRFVIISGCSGGGKSTLLAELARRGHAIVEEPGRRIVAQELSGDGAALPWVDGVAFAHRAIELALADRSAAETRPGLTFFDRSAIDAASALEYLTGERLVTRLGGLPHYHKTVFLVPPWPEIYINDRERRHDYEDAMAEYQRLCWSYPLAGYDVSILDRTNVSERAGHILKILTPPRNATGAPDQRPIEL